jgi:hypothetical protein
MGILFLNEGVEQRIFDIVAHASNPLHWYRPGKSDWVPGDKPEYVLLSGDTKAVFSWTETTAVFRHLSVSVRTPGKYPDLTVVWTLAHKFGFQGATPDKDGFVHKPSPTWGCGSSQAHECVTLIEQVS